MQPTYSINLAGTEYELRFDIVGLSSAQTMLKAMGFPRNSVWTIADTPYDLSEEVVILMNGINGARRLKKETPITMEEAQHLVEAHFEFVADKVSEVPDDNDAMALFNAEQAGFMEKLAVAVRASLGFRRGPKGGAPGRV